MKLISNKKIILIFLLIISLVQSFIIVLKENKNNKEINNKIKIEVEEEDFKDVQSLLNEVKRIKGIEIIEINNEDNKGIDIKIDGNYEKINSVVQFIKKYKIDEYSIKYKDGFYSLLFHLFVE